MSQPTSGESRSPHPARQLWQLIEPIHAVTYFAPACRDAMTEIGLQGFWMGYFAGRAAPLGAVDAAVVEATFMNFAPSRVRRAVPHAWAVATPQVAIEARADAAAIALRQLVVNIDEHARRIVPLLEGAVRAARCDGRPLAAANQALELPADPAARLWQLATTLREHRGDGHVAALVGAGSSEATMLQAARGWSDTEWAAAGDRLCSLGWLDEDLRLTEDGALVRMRVEQHTDDIAMQPYRDGLTETGFELLMSVLRAPAHAITSSGLLPFPNPIGVQAPPRA